MSNIQKFEYKTFEIEIQNSVFASRSLSAKEIERAINEFAAEGWEYVSSIEKITNGYTDQIILVFKRNKES